MADTLSQDEMWSQLKAKHRENGELRKRIQELEADLLILIKALKEIAVGNQFAGVYEDIATEALKGKEDE